MGVRSPQSYFSHQPMSHGPQMLHRAPSRKIYTGDILEFLRKPIAIYEFPMVGGYTNVQPLDPPMTLVNMA